MINILSSTVGDQRQTFSHNVVSGTNLLMLFIGGGASSPSPSATYNGINMVGGVLTSVSGGELFPLAVSIFVLKNPPTGSHNIVISGTGMEGILATNLSGVDVNSGNFVSGLNYFSTASINEAESRSNIIAQANTTKNESLIIGMQVNTPNPRPSGFTYIAGQDELYSSTNLGNRNYVIPYKSVPTISTASMGFQWTQTSGYRMLFGVVEVLPEVPFVSKQVFIT